MASEPGKEKSGLEHVSAAAGAVKGAIKAGNDIFMPGTAANHAELLESLANTDATYPITREDLEKSASRMIALAWRLERR